MPRAVIRELRQLRDRKRVFHDRAQAGRVLASMLSGLEASAVVAAIPSGGAPVGLEVASLLGLEFDCLVVRKLRIPGNPEAGFGAASLSGQRWINAELARALGLTSDDIEREARRVGRELADRNALFRQGRPPPDWRGRTAVLVDDGLASGYTMLAACAEAEAAGARRLVIAAPTAPERSLALVEERADEIVCPNIRTEPSFAVAEAYAVWRDLEREEVVAMLAEAGVLGGGRPRFPRQGRAMSGNPLDEAAKAP